MIIVEELMSEPRYFILENQNPVRVKDRLIWAKWCRDNLKDRIVAHHQVDRIVIRTIFTGVDLDECREDHDRRQRPKLYESYAWRIGASEPIQMRYYTSHKDAIAGHLQLLELYQNAASTAEAASGLLV